MMRIACSRELSRPKQRPLSIVGRVQIFVEGSGGGFEPLEGEELQSALEDVWENCPSDFADAYIPRELCGDDTALDEFYRRLSGLIWLHRAVGQSVKAMAEKHARQRQTGEHRVPGWAAESDMVLDEEIYLREALSKVNSGALMASCAAALESLATAFLYREEDRPLQRKGLQRKISALLERWPEIEDADQIRDDVKWVADRRNAFAHSLIDEAETYGRVRGPWTFDEAAVEEAFDRVGWVAGNLATAYLRSVRST